MGSSSWDEASVRSAKAKSNLGAGRRAGRLPHSAKTVDAAANAIEDFNNPELTIINTTGATTWNTGPAKAISQSPSLMSSLSKVAVRGIESAFPQSPTVRAALKLMFPKTYSSEMIAEKAARMLNAQAKGLAREEAFNAKMVQQMASLANEVGFNYDMVNQVRGLAEDASFNQDMVKQMQELMSDATRDNEFQTQMHNAWNYRTDQDVDLSMIDPDPVMARVKLNAFQQAHADAWLTDDPYKYIMDEMDVDSIEDAFNQTMDMIQQEDPEALSEAYRQLRQAIDEGDEDSPEIYLHFIKRFTKIYDRASAR